MATWADSAREGARVCHAHGGDPLVRRAACALAAGLSAMLGRSVGVEAARGLDPNALLLAPERAARSGAGAGQGGGAPPAPAAGAAALAGESSLGSAAPGAALPSDGFALTRRGGALMLSAASARGALHAAWDLLERLGARFALGQAPEFPRSDAARLEAVEPYSVAPAFARRAFASDIMTWHYGDAARLQTHLEHDREFVAWMAWRGLNAFFYIRHAQDTRLVIHEAAPILAEGGIAVECGGHVLPLLMPRERLETSPKYFPIDEHGRRNPRGNLCASNPAALELVAKRALGYLREHPEMAALHVWGADVHRGAWCRCTGCAALSPQLQYMKVANEIAEAFGRELGAAAPPVTYLAYHDTLEPDPVLRPQANVWFEWAPRERCYAHAIDDPGCDVNPRYFDSLRRYVDLFDGRGQIFEYYADAILFGGVGFATPSVIVRDLRAYHRMGLRSVSCLTFGAFSALAYPVNLETFARAARSLDLDGDAMAERTAGLRHPRCAGAMGQAYRAVARASAMALRHGEVLRPPADAAGAPARRARLLGAAAAMREAVAAAETAMRPEVGAERDLWKYSAEALEGAALWLEARTFGAPERRAAGERAIAKIDGAIRHLRDIDPRLRGSWGVYDLERIREIWLGTLRRRLEA